MTQTQAAVPSTDNTATVESVAEILRLEPNAKLPDVIAKLNDIIDVLNNKRPTRNRGPESTREMTVDDAKKIMLGEYKDKSHKECATLLGLSYGQVYSARGGYTFKEVYKEASKLKKA